MKVLTLIPETNSYGLAILLVLILSSTTLATHFHARFFAKRSVGFMPVYCCVLGFTVSWGFLIFDWRTLINPASMSFFWALPLGLLVGLASLWLNLVLTRTTIRRTIISQHQKKQSLQKRHFRNLNVQPVSMRGATAKVSGRKQLVKKANVQEAFGPLTLVAGFLEEVAFRGWLVAFCFLVPGAWSVVALMGTLIVFSLTHIHFGWSQVLGKLPLGAFCLMAVMIHGTLFPALIGHVFFNSVVWYSSMRARTAPVSQKIHLAPKL